MLEAADVLDARDRVDEVARRTPLDYSHTFSTRTGAEVHLKLENLQRTGSFKIRGATNRIALLDDADREAGVVTASAGNHAQGVALAASRAGVDATIVMPEHAPISKVDATRSYGGEVVLHGDTYEAAQRRAHEIEADEDRTYIHAFDDEAVMAGQGTVGLEVLEELPEPDVVVVPVGGGGLVSGVATAVSARRPEARVVGVQAEGAAAMADSLRKGRRVEESVTDTIADGIAVGALGEATFEVVRERVDEVVTVPDSAIAMAVVDLLERSKTLVEGAGAVAVAALVEGTVAYEDDDVVVACLSGGNIDLNVLTTVVMRGLVERGRYLKLSTVLKDRPGALERLLEVLSAANANIYGIQHDRTSRDIAMNAAEVELDVETRGHDHAAALIEELEDHGYEVEVLV